MKVLLLDIEGTITPITFVRDQLFPFVRSNLQSHLNQCWDSEELQQDIAALRELSASEIAAGDEKVVRIPPSFKTDCVNNRKKIQEAVVSNVYYWMDNDRKLTALKRLQGHIWAHGYDRGELKGQLFEDVAPTLSSLRKKDSELRIYIYSSGSVESQKLLLNYSTDGDLRPLISGYFDTTIGVKKDPGSYRRIAEEIGVASPEEILFLTDVLAEANAAKEAGLGCWIVIREGNAPLDPGHGFTTIETLKSLRAPEGESIYHEKQRLAHCAIHTVNSVLQDKNFNKAFFDDISASLPQDREFPHRTCWGHYSHSVIEAALDLKGCRMEWFDTKLPIDNLQLDDITGLIINVQANHWFAVSFVAGIFWNCDSKLNEPMAFRDKAHLQDFLKEQIAQREALIFVVKKR